VGGQDNRWLELEAFIRTRLPSMLRFAHALCGRPEEAEDLVMEAMVRTGARWPHLRRDDPDAYLRRAILNIYLNNNRRDARVLLMAHPPDQAGPEPDVAVVQRDEVKRLLDQLPPRTRAAVVLRYYLDQSEQRTAELLGVSPGTVKRQLHDARQQLRSIASVTKERL